jgi:hypothetical protein
VLAELERGAAAVIVAKRPPAEFRAVQQWARDTFIATVTSATTVSYPAFVGPARDAPLA